MYTKNTNFGDFGGCKPYFWSHNGEIWPESADLGVPLSEAKFCKNFFKGLAP